MAGRNHRLLKQTYRLFASAGSEADGPTAAAFASSTVSSAPAGEEFDESDVWGSIDGGDARPDHGGNTKAAAPFPSSRVAARKPSARTVVAASLPVNIPDWSKILRDEYVKNKTGADCWNAEEVEEEGGEEGMTGMVVPPHEYLWKKRGAVASFSVHEGVGRTLKGRDLSRVRNAVWRQTGFQD